MDDSYEKASFREGWCPVGHSPDALRGFQRFADVFFVRAEPLYYFKPLSEFIVRGLTEDEKFEDIDSLIVAEFGCDGDDVITVGTEKYGPVIIMPEYALKAARVALPRWREPVRRKMRRRAHLTLVPT